VRSTVLSGVLKKVFELQATEGALRYALSKAGTYAIADEKTSFQITPSGMSYVEQQLLGGAKS
jgi:hypothetical protein